VGGPTGAAEDYDPLLERTGRARFVLLGEASHGTHEFYAERAAITKRLITEQGLTAVAAEADWPDAYRVNLFVRGGRSEKADTTHGGLRLARCAPTAFRRWGAGVAMWEKVE